MKREIQTKILTALFPDKYHTRGMHGALKYLLSKNRIIQNDEYIQDVAAKEYNVSTVTIRNNMKKIIEELNEKNIESTDDLSKYYLRFA